MYFHGNYNLYKAHNNSIRQDMVLATKYFLYPHWHWLCIFVSGQQELFISQVDNCTGSPGMSLAINVTMTKTLPTNCAEIYCLVSINIHQFFFHMEMSSLLCMHILVRCHFARCCSAVIKKKHYHQHLPFRSWSVHNKQHYFQSKTCNLINMEISRVKEKHCC